MPDIRARISDAHGGQLDALRRATGYEKTVILIEHLITEAYFRYCYSNSPADVRAKAAQVLSKLKGFTPALKPSDVERVSFEGKAVKVWTGFSGEPYVIAERDWK